MRRARVYNHDRFAGILEETSQGYRFTYDRDYAIDAETSPVSLTLPKSKGSYESKDLFPFFYGLLSEGSTRTLQCRLLRIDEEDDFGLLLATGRDSVGSVRVCPVEEAK